MPLLNRNTVDAIIHVIKNWEFLSFLQNNELTKLPDGGDWHNFGATYM